MLTHDLSLKIFSFQPIHPSSYSYVRIVVLSLVAVKHFLRKKCAVGRVYTSFADSTQSCHPRTAIDFAIT